MHKSFRLRRSVLYIPASNAHALEKAKTLMADALIFDLEDSVAPEAKDLARKQAMAAVASGDYGDRELIVRVNGMDTDWVAEDLKAVSHQRPNAVLLPEIESASQVHTTTQQLPEDLNLWCMIEKPIGVLHVEQIASASPRMKCLVIGPSVLLADLNARYVPSREPLLISLSLCVLAARAYGLSVLDGVHLDLEDDDGFRASCQQGRDLGFDGKTLIHPKQIGLCNDVFTPNEADIVEAQAVIDAFEQAEAEGRGVVAINGKMVENLHASAARHLLNLADAIAAHEQAMRGET